MTCLEIRRHPAREGPDNQKTNNQSGINFYRAVYVALSWDRAVYDAKYDVDSLKSGTLPEPTQAIDE